MLDQRDLFDPSHYAGVRKPLAEAESLPPWCYTSETFYRREVERIFTKTWVFAGRTDELADPGAFMALEAPAGPCLIIRDTQGRLRAFANSCRHRGTRLLQGRGRRRAIVCPYHSWTYAPDGSLRSAPGMEGAAGFDPEENGLLPWRLEEWGGFLFVCSDQEAPSLAKHLGDLPEVFAGHRPEALVCTRRVEFDVACNWKLLAENALEAYHTGTVHRATLGQQSAQFVQTHGNWTALHVAGEESIATLPGQPPPLAPIPGLTGMAAQGTYFTMIYPCTQLAFAQDCVWWLDIQPCGPEACHLVLGSCFPAKSTGLPDFEQLVAPYYRRWDEATPEDNRISELQQAGQRICDRPPGRLSPLEGCVHALDNWVLDRVLNDATCPPGAP